jgi:hypothetical protein
MAGNAGIFIHSLLKYIIGIRYILAGKSRTGKKFSLPAGKNSAGRF